MDFPSAFLPRLKELNEHTASQLHIAISKLVVLYLPEVRGTATTSEDIENLRADKFERSFAIRWLTTFAARGAEWAECAPDDEDDQLNDFSSTIDSSIPNQTPFEVPAADNHSSRTSAHTRATALLAACAGVSASGALSRTFSFPTQNLSSPITITLRDEPLSSGDHMAVGLQTWGSACVLAERVAKDSLSFGFSAQTESRVLELGAGTGLLSLLAGKLSAFNREQGGPGHTVIATDYHPAVMKNLCTNVESNFPDKSSIEVHPLDWSLYTTGKVTTSLSRVPSTVVTPVGTPLPKIVAPASDPGLETHTSTIPTPSVSFSSPLSPPSPRTPQTPKTPQITRPPPPNLARAVFSRLLARGVKFEMPGETLTEQKQTLGSEKTDSGGVNKSVCSRTESELKPSNLSRALVEGTRGEPEQSLSDTDCTSPGFTDSSLYIPDSPSTTDPGIRQHSQAISPNDYAKDIRSQRALDVSNSLANNVAVDTLLRRGTAEETDGRKHVASSPHVSLHQKTASPGQGCDNCANRSEQLAGVSDLETEGGYVNPEVVENQACNSDAGAALGPKDQQQPNSTMCTSTSPFDKPFDVIFGADIIYELSHASLVHDVVWRLLRRPSYAPGLPPAYFHLIMPLRSTHADEVASVDRTFPRAEDVCGGEEHVLAIIKTETYARSAGVGRADEVQYVYYRMAWVQ